MNPDALIFDLDGTLWDAVETYTKAWNTYFDRNQLEYSLSKKDLDGLMGLEEAVFLEKVLPNQSVDERAESYKEVVQIQYDLIDQVGGHIYDGVLEMIPLLAKKYQLFIVSNCPKRTIKHFLNFSKLDVFFTDTLAHGQNYRPKFENIKSLILKHQLESPVYIGDTNGDMIQSKKAKVPFIFMEYGFGKSASFHRSFETFETFASHYLNA